MSYLIAAPDMLAASAADAEGIGSSLSEASAGAPTAPRWRIKVNSSVEHVGQHYRLGPTKTHERREVPIPPPVLTLLRDRVDSWAPGQLVFPGADGYLKNHEFRKVFDPAATGAGVPGLSPARVETHLRLLGDPVAGVDQDRATAASTQDRYHDARQLRAPVS